MESKFGDRVQPRSGGPSMVVETVFAPFFVWRYLCIWTDAEGNAHLDVFRASELEHVADEARGMVEVFCGG